MWKKLTLIAALVSLAALVVLPCATSVAKPPPKTVPGGLGLIAFTPYNPRDYSVGPITLINPDGSGATPLWTAIPDSISREPVWSPEFSDGTVKLAYPGRDSATNTEYLNVVNVFARADDGSFQLSVGTPTRVERLAEPSSIRYPDWSPAVEDPQDGAQRVRVAYTFYTGEHTGPNNTVGPNDTPYVIHIVDLIYHLTDQSFSVDPASPDPIVLDPGPGAYYYVARFSPDGQWLVLSRSDWQPDGKYNYHCSIRLAKADGTLIDGSVDKLLSDDYGYPAWSPDGSQLAFFRKPNLYIAELGTDSAGVPYVKSTRQLTKNGPNASWWDFSWSPDGTQIVFNYTAIGKVFVNGAEYGVPNGTSYGLAYGQCPDWSPMDLPRLP